MNNYADIRRVSYEVRVTSKICIIFEIIQSRQSRFLKRNFTTTLPLRRDSQNLNGQFQYKEGHLLLTIR